MEAETRPLLSVMIPVWNGAAFLAEALASVLAEAAHPYEIVLVDDGSTDQTPAIARSFGGPLRYHRQAHAGLAVARNQALALAQGGLLAFLDADDRWPRGRVALLRRALDLHPDCGLAQGRLQRLVRTAGSDRFTLVDESWRAPSVCTALIRRSAFDRVGLFDTRFPNGHDVDWLLRARETGLAEIAIDDVTLHYRRHDANMTNDIAVDQPALLRVLARAVARRRGAGTAST
jgi:glycosyltransferase involved in cell wall biosynthesis